MDGTSGFRIARLAGLDVRIDPSWFILFFLILWSLSFGTFPYVAPGLSRSAYLAMGLSGALLFFASILLHELGHAVVARTKGIEVNGITLFVFGGIAHTESEPKRPEDELLIAGIGPVVSLALGGLFFGAAALGRAAGWSPAVHEVARYLGFINVVLAVFNLLPGFPLDGGRVFRALAWRQTGDLSRATRWAATSGRWLGLGMIVFGAFEALTGALVSGLWLVLIGMFLRGAASMAESQHALERALQGVRAADVMSRDLHVVDAHLSLRELATGPAVVSTRSSFPVRDHGRIVGTLPLTRIEQTPREAWSSTAVGDVMTALEDEAVVAPEADMHEVFDKLRGPGTPEVFVMDDGAVVGSISKSDIAELATRARALAAS